MITSAANARVKRIINLNKKKKLREEEGVFLVEGARMFEEVPLDKLLEVYVSESFWEKHQDAVERTLAKDVENPRTEAKEDDGFTDGIKAGGRVQVEIVKDDLFEKMCDTKTPQGVLCVVERMRYAMDDVIGTEETPLVLILDNLQDPGNLGTILRAGEAAGVTGILLSPACVDLYNPKTIRSTMGAIYRVPFYYAEDEWEFKSLIAQMKEAGIFIYAAHLQGALSYDLMDYKRSCAFMIGNEGNGLREEIAALSDDYIKIPMYGEVESLNAAMAATVLAFEAARQRR